MAENVQCVPGEREPAVNLTEIDKGHGSFKLNMQVVNTSHPNSIWNTHLLAVFKAGDNVHKLHTALDQFKLQVDELQEMRYRCMYIHVQ